MLRVAGPLYNPAEVAGGGAPSLQAPEQIARAKIDRLLAEAGWVLQDRDGFDRTAALGVAVREFSLPAGFCILKRKGPQRIS